MTIVYVMSPRLRAGVEKRLQTMILWMEIVLTFPQFVLTFPQGHAN